MGTKKCVGYKNLLQLVRSKTSRTWDIRDAQLSLNWLNEIHLKVEIVVAIELQ